MAFNVSNPTKTVKPKQIGRKFVVIEARRWFDKINGNTYHSVQVYVNGKLIGENPFTYGYGESYLQSAHEILLANGYFGYEKTKETVPVKDRKTGEILYHKSLESENKNNSYYEFTRDMQDHRRQYHVNVVDVDRKRDL